MEEKKSIFFNYQSAFLIVFFLSINFVLTACGGGNDANLPPKDTDPPFVTLMDPVDGAQDVSILKLIDVVFNEVIDSDSIIVGNLDIVGLNGRVNGNWEAQKDGRTIRFIPSQPNELEYGTTYNVVISDNILDIAGNKAIATKLSFTTEATPIFPKIVLSVQPPVQSINIDVAIKITINFQQNVTPASLSTGATGSFRVYDSSNTLIKGVVSVAPKNLTSIIFEPLDKLNLLTSYKVLFTTDLQFSGGAVLPKNQSWTFTTRDGVITKGINVLSDNSLDIKKPKLGLTPNGDILSIWLETPVGTNSNSAHKRTWVNSTGSWNAPSLLKSNVNYYIDQIGLTVGGSGQAVAYWRSNSIASNGMQKSIEATYYDPVTKWNTGFSVLSTSLNPGAIDLQLTAAVSPNGDARVVWLQTETIQDSPPVGGNVVIPPSSYTYTIYDHFYDRANNIGWNNSPGIVYQLNQSALFPVGYQKFNIKAISNSESILTWLEYIGGSTINGASGNYIWHNRTNGWNTKFQFGGGRSINYSNSVSGYNNLPTVAWVNVDDLGLGPINGLHISAIKSDNTQIDTQIVTAPPDTAGFENPVVSYSAYGKAIVLWSGFGNIFFSNLLPNSEWTKPLEISKDDPATLDVKQIKIVVDSIGNAFATWLHFEGQLQTLWQSRYIAGGNWTTPTMLSSNTLGVINDYDMIMTKNGSVKIIWSEPDATSFDLKEAIFE